jgi:murein DD-endopeptidase MepM/ murein hydrolase activator NlpD
MLDCAVIGLVFLIATVSVIVHAAGGDSPGGAISSPASDMSRSQAPAAANATPLPLLTPPVQALTGDTYTPPATDTTQPPASASDSSPASNAAVAPLAQSVFPVLPLPVVAAAVPSQGRLSRAEALPGPAVASGVSSGPNSGGVSPLTQSIDHTILSGESLSSIASSYGVTVASVMANNPGLEDFDLIRPGQTLRIPSTTGLLYNVQPGDTLSGISQRYGVSADEVLNLPANALKNADDIKAGATILLPGNVSPPPPPAPVLKPLVVPASPPIVGSSAGSSGSPASSSATPAPTAAVARFIWPVQGPITQGFGVPELGVGAPHTGIDIGLYGRDGTPIAAAAAGTVIFSGGDACCGYGYYVIVQHAGGFTTLYGHLSRRGVSVGDTVGQGDTVGYAGSTGFSTGTHLHFEMHLNGALVSPMKYLP